MKLQTLQVRFDLLVALAQLRAYEVERSQRLLERKHVFAPPIAQQALGDFVDAGVDAHVLHRAQRQPVAFSGHDGAQDLLARLAHNVGDDVGELDIHLRERLLHVLHITG